MTEQKWVIDGVEAPADADIYAHDSFRSTDKIHTDGCLYYWDGVDNEWFDGVYMLDQCKNAHDYQERPVASLDAPSEVTEDVSLNKSTDFLKASLNIQEERGKQYDSEEGERSFSKVATAFTAITGKELLGSDVALIQQILKDVRLYTNMETPHMDSLLDKTSYASLHCEEVINEWKARGNT
jgi:hypothetical protein